jgi:transposase
MHIRFVTVGRHGRKQRYPQLVQSFRRPSDGMPAHRVLAGLADLSPLELDNLRTALEANRRGKRVALVSVPKAARPLKPAANLRYMDLAVLLEVWRQWQLDELFGSVLAPSEEHLAGTAVICVLTLQRCSEPDSKLAATRWLPRTALPELLAIDPLSFNNTRIHRVLESLEEATDQLMTKLIHRYQERNGAFATLFVDVTDTWFVGHGPSQAQRAKVKDGHVARKVGIVLLCNERGYPLRWEVVEGRAPDSSTISTMLRSVAGLSWCRNVPTVCDRAMGKTAHLRQMLEAELRFVTALTTPEFDAYVPAIPYAAVADLEPALPAADDGLAREAAVAAARQCALDAGLSHVEHDLLVGDFGIVERVEDDGDEAAPAQAPVPEDMTVRAMQLGRDIDADVATGRCGSVATAARRRGISKALAHKYRRLRLLPEALQLQILEGRLAGHPLSDLLGIARLPDAEQQHQAFAALARTTPKVTTRRQPRLASSADAKTQPKPVRLRAVVYFNPERFVDERLHARKQLERVRCFVETLNGQLSSPRSRMKPPQILAAVDRQLRKDDLLEAFDCQMHTETVANRERYRITLPLNHANWARRRRYDGFSVIVAHPELPHDPTTLCRLYREKDRVEKDFQTIKGVVELRPVRHRDDAKVRAHVTLCMLALLLERTLQHQLRPLCSPRAALAALAPVDLNRYATEDGQTSYLITHTDEEQDAILRRLRLRRLALDEDIAHRITPR